MNTQHQKQNIIKTFIRDEKNNPRGIALIVREGDEILYGYSLLHTTKDRFDKILGTNIALKRAYSPSFNLPSVPERQEAVLSAFQHLEERAVKYFKDLDPEIIRIKEEEIVELLDMGQFQPML